MFDIIKKTMLTGIGLAVMTKEKAEKFANDLAETGEMSEKEGKKLVDDLLKNSEEIKKDLEAKVEGMVQKALEKVDLASKKDIKRIEEKIKEFEKKESSFDRSTTLE